MGAVGFCGLVLIDMVLLVLLDVSLAGGSYVIQQLFYFLRNFLIVNKLTTLFFFLISVAVCMDSSVHPFCL